MDNTTNLYNLAQSPQFLRDFTPSHHGDELSAIAITASRKSGPSCTLEQYDLTKDEARHFLRDGPEQNSHHSPGPTTSNDSLRLVCVGREPEGPINCDSTVFQDILAQVELDPWLEYNMRTYGSGFHFSSSARSVASHDAGHRIVDSYFFGATFVTAVWTTTRYPESAPLSTTTKCLMICTSGRFPRPGEPTTTSYNATKHEPPSAFEAPHPITWITALFQTSFPPALCLPLALAIQTFRWSEEEVRDTFHVVKNVEARTGHGSWGPGRFEEKRDSIPNLTARLGRSQNIVGSAFKHLDMVDSVLKYLEQQKRTAKGDIEDENLSSVVEIHRWQVSSARSHCESLERRIRNQSAVLFAFLTHEDSKINITVANASRDLAEAARRDGSSMKTIAVLTMVFLPATFLSSLFSMPSLGWDQPDKFVVYWAIVVPITFATFVVWAGITQRQQIMELVRRVPPAKKLEHNMRLSEGG